MIELRPEDLIISVYKQAGQGGMHTAKLETGVRVFHKPSGLDISCEKHRSQHRNRNECLTIIQDLLTPFEEGDIIYTNYSEGCTTCGEALLTSVRSVAVAESDEYNLGRPFAVYLDHIGHTKEGYIYKTVKRKQAMVEDYQKDIDRLNAEIKELNHV